MMERITWIKEWCLDGGEIDRQHKNLISILNRIIDREINIHELIIALIEYSSDHFVDEEVLMLKNNYPEDRYLDHKQEHRFFTKALLEISFGLLWVTDTEEFENVIKKVEHFCFTWFNTHFMNTDKALVQFLKEGGVLENIECH